jgi:hypothetical protein
MSLVRVMQRLLVPNRPWIEDTRHPEDDFFAYMRDLDAQVRLPVTRRYQGVTVANLPTDAVAGDTAFASDGRKNGEGAASGTGVLVFHDGTAWRASDTGATVAA